MRPDEKKQLLDLKRALKRRGNKHRRQQLKRSLAADPEGAADVEGDVGRHSSAWLNGAIDNDRTRLRRE